MAQELEWSKGASEAAAFDEAVCALLMGEEGDRDAWRAPEGPVAAARAPAWAAFARDEERAVHLPEEAVREWKARSGLRALDEEGLRQGPEGPEGSAWPEWSRWADLMDCGAGGNCFFLSTSYALFGHVGAARALRALACAGATRLTGATAAAARTETALRADEYATDDLIWGLCSAARVRVQIVDADDPSGRCPVYRFGGDEAARPVATLFGVGLRRSGGGHFCALVPRDDAMRERARKRLRRSPSPDRTVQKCDCENCRP